MSGWIGVVFVGALALAAGLLLLRTQRPLWTLMAAIVVFGLAGYAWQGSPDYPSAPASAAAGRAQADPVLVELRREFFGPSELPSNFVTVADGFARQGNYRRAAQLLQGVVADNPEDGEAWLALGIVLVEYADGQVTKPADYALSRAGEVLEGNPGPAFFTGVNALRQGDLPAARQAWVRGLQQAGPQAEGREFVAERVLALDRMMQAMAAQQGGQTEGSELSTGQPPE